MTQTPANAIVVDYDVPHAPAKVWRALTESGLVASWLMDNDLRPVVGHHFTFHAQPMPGWDGTVRCEVTAVEPEKRLQYTWRGGSEDPQYAPFRIDTVVTWTLSPSATGGTLLRLEHSGFTDKNAFALEGLARGWRGKVGERLAAVIAEMN